MSKSLDPKERYFSKSKRVIKPTTHKFKTVEEPIKRFKTPKKMDDLKSLKDIQKTRSKNLKKSRVSIALKNKTEKEQEEDSLKFVPKSVREFLTKKHKEEDIKPKKGEQRELPYGEGYPERQLFEKDEYPKQPSQGSRERGEREKRLIAKAEALKKIKKLNKQEEEDISKSTKRIREGDRRDLIEFKQSESAPVSDNEDEDEYDRRDLSQFRQAEAVPEDEDDYDRRGEAEPEEIPLSSEVVDALWNKEKRHYKKKLTVEDLKQFLNNMKKPLKGLIEFLITQNINQLEELMRTANSRYSVPEGISSFIKAIIRKRRNKNESGGNIDFKGRDAVIKKHLRGLARAGGLGDFIKSALGSVVEAFKENPADFFKKVVSHAKTGLEYGKKGLDFAKQGHSYLKSKFKGGSLRPKQINVNDAVIKKHLRGLAKAGGLGDFIKSALGSVVEAFKENPADFFKKVVSHAKTGLEYGKKGLDFAKQGHSYLKSKFKGGDISTRQVIPQKLTGTQTKQKLSEMIKKAGVL